MPAKKESTSELKKQLKELQTKIATIEASQSQPDVPEQRLNHNQDFRIETFYDWSSPERIFIPRNRKWFTYLFLIILLIVVVLLFVQQFIIIAPVAAIGFVSYILATVPPHQIEHKLTTEGINSGGHSYLWQEMSDFWITQKGDEKLINIETYLAYPRRIIMLVGTGDVEEIKQVMIQFIPFREIPKENLLDKFLNNLTERFHKFAS